MLLQILRLVNQLPNASIVPLLNPLLNDLFHRFGFDFSATLLQDQREEYRMERQRNQLTVRFLRPAFKQTRLFLYYHLADFTCWGLPQVSPPEPHRLESFHRLSFDLRQRDGGALPGSRRVKVGFHILGVRVIARSVPRSTSRARGAKQLAFFAIGVFGPFALGSPNREFVCVALVCLSLIVIRARLSAFFALCVALSVTLITARVYLL